MTKEQILDEVMKLDPGERDELAEEIRQRGAPELAPEQLTELGRRAAALEAGSARTFTMDEVMQRLRARFPQ